MKKGIYIAVISIAFLSLSTLSFAQKSMLKPAKAVKQNLEVVRGQIVSIDPSKNEIVLKDNKTATERTIPVDAKVISSLKTGEQVKVKINPEDNKVESIQEVKKPAKHQAK